MLPMLFRRPTSIAAQVGTYLKAPTGVLVHVRTATKKVSGSKTNKNDSAGRRLGPKAYENHFVKTGQIIMRQRGTKIHPGENVGIGRDHTIFALEPGYVRFYLDPFHPLRKYVGVALKKDIQLPKPHFDARIRRFGYNPLRSKQAEIEEAKMSRKELLAQPDLKKKTEELAKDTAERAAFYATRVMEPFPNASETEKKSGVSRLLFISRKLALNEPLEYAREQATFNALFEIELSHRKGRILKDELETKSADYLVYAKDFDSKISVDFADEVHPYYRKESRDSKADVARSKFNYYKKKAIELAEKTQIQNLISHAGIFSREGHENEASEYFPNVLPTNVPETVIEGVSSKKLSKNAVAVRRFDPKSRKVSTIVRTKDAFLH